jgi:hypothetical protein
MKFQEFVDMLAEVMTKHKALFAARPEPGQTQVMAQANLTVWESGEMRCQVCLKEDGSVSENRTEIAVCFSLQP